MAEEAYAGTRGECRRISKETSGLTCILSLDHSSGKPGKPCFLCSELRVEIEKGGQA